MDRFDSYVKHLVEKLNKAYEDGNDEHIAVYTICFVNAKRWEARERLNDDLETQKLIEEKVGADLDWPEAWNDEK